MLSVARKRKENTEKREGLQPSLSLVFIACIYRLSLAFPMKPHTHKYIKRDAH
jgi:hypothetical protein